MRWEPDPKFKEEVNIRHKRVYRVFKGRPFFNSLGLFLDLSMRIATSSLTLSKIEGRIMGAKLYKDQEGLKLQKESYNTVLQNMMVHPFLIYYSPVGNKRAERIR